MAEDGGNLSGALDPGAPQDRYSLPRTYIRLNDLSGRGPRAGHSEELEVEPAPPACDEEDEGSTHGGESLPYPTLAPVVFFYLKQSTRPRSWCLKMVRNPYPFYQCGRVFHSPGQVRPSGAAGGKAGGSESLSEGGEMWYWRLPQLLHHPSQQDRNTHLSAGVRSPVR